MGRGKQESGQQGGAPGPARAWFSRNREELARDVLAGLLVLSAPIAIGLLFGRGHLAGADNSVWITALVAAAAFAAGLLAARRLRRRMPGPLPPTASEADKLSAYVDSFTEVLHRLLLGEVNDVEAELLIRPAQLIERLTGGTVQLAVFMPVARKEGEDRWHLPYVAGVSRRECSEFEVALKDSYLARMQARWTPRDEVLAVPDLQEQRFRKAGADFEAFAQAGCRMLRCSPFGTGTRGTSRPCIVLLSKNPGSFSGFDDYYLILLGSLLSVHSILVEQNRIASEQETPE